MNTAYVYTLTDPRNGMPFYVGKGVGRRCHFHAWEAKNSDKPTYKLNKIRKIQSLGLDIVVRKVEENVSHEQAKELECFLIAEMREFGIDLTNATDGGDGRAGYVASQETRSKLGRPKSEADKKRLSEALKGDKHFYYGVPCSDERKAAIIAGTTGVKKSTTINMRKPKRKEQCPHCGIMASGGNLAKWHMNNCKSKE
jgi:hypothetical protein